MVTVSTRPQPGSKVTLEIEVPAAEVDRHFATAYLHVAERTKVPGFRPGKAPRHVIDRFVGHGSVVAEAIDHLVGEAYDAALDQAAIIPIDQPEVEIDSTAVSEGTSVRFTATVAVRPEVALGAYTGYPFGLEPVEVTDEPNGGASADETSTAAPEASAADNRTAPDARYSGFSSRGGRVP